MPRTPYQRTILVLSVATAFGLGFWSGFGSTVAALHIVHSLSVIDCTTDDDCEAKNGPMTEADFSKLRNSTTRTFNF